VAGVVVPVPGVVVGDVEPASGAAGAGVAGVEGETPAGAVVSEGVEPDAGGTVWSVEAGGVVGVVLVVPVVSVPLVDGALIVPLPLPEVLLDELLARSLGIRTVSTAWMIPLVAIRSAWVTVASLILTAPPCEVTCRVLPSRVGGEVGEVMEVAVAASTRAGSTWYLSTAASLVGSFSRSFSAPLGSFLKAALVGANTVNGPGPCRALTRSALFSSFTKVLNRLSLMARATMSLVGAIGVDMPDPLLIGGVMVDEPDIGDDGDIIPIEPLFLSAMVPVAS